MKTHEVKSEQVVILQDMSENNNLSKQEPEQKIEENIKKNKESEEPEGRIRKSARYWTNGVTRKSASWFKT